MNVEVDKPSGTLSLAGDFNIQRNWTNTLGVMNAGTSNVTFISGYATTVDTGTQQLNNVVIAKGGHNFTATKLKVGGSLTIQGANYFTAAPGAITVAGDLSSTAPSLTTSGGANITMVGGDGSKVYTGSDFNTGGNGVFPAGGIVIAKGGNNLQSNVTTPLTGKLQIDGVGAFGGSFAVAGPVAINTGSITPWYGSGGKLVFSGGVNQVVTVSNGGRLPGVVVDKTGGSLTLPATIDVVGNWKYNQGTVNSAFVRFIGGDKSVDTTGVSGSMAFNNVELNVDSLNASNPPISMVVGGKLTLTRVGAIGGVIEAKGDVDTSVTASLYSWNGGKILFNGPGAQNLTATADHARVPGVEIDKATGSLILANNGNVLDVNGNWKYDQGTVVTTGTTVKFVGGDKSVDTTGVSGSMAFNNVELDVDSLNASNPSKTMVVGGKLTLTRVGAIGGVINALGDVDTAASGASSWNGGKLLFNGNGVQNLTATAATGNVPAVEINKTGGSLALASNGNDIGVNGNWNYVKGTVNAAGSTVNFVGADKTVNTGAYPTTMTFGNVKITIGGNSLTATNLAVGGALTINSVAGIYAAAGKITVAGDLTSNDTTVGGNADITLVGSGAATITANPGAFPGGGIILSRGYLSTVTANVTTALAGPLTFNSGSYFGGTFTVSGNVVTNNIMLHGLPGNKLIFTGGNDQTITAVAGARIPGVEINKTGGTLKLPSDVSVAGDWTYVNGGVNTNNGKVTILSADGSDATIDTGSSPSMKFNNVAVSTPYGKTLVATNMDVAGKLTLTAVTYISGTITAEGDVDTGATSGAYTHGGKILFTGGNNQLITATTSIGRLPSVEINKSGGTLTLAGNGNTIGVTGDWIYVDGTVDQTTQSSVKFVANDTATNRTVTTVSSTGSMSFYDITVDIGYYSTLTVSNDGGVATKYRNSYTKTSGTVVGSIVHV